MKATASLLVLALALLSTLLSGVDSQQKETDQESTAENQQISVAVSSDLDTGATHHDVGHLNGYSNNIHDESGYKGSKGFKDDISFHGSKHGDHGKAADVEYHDKGGKLYKGHNDKNKYYGDFEQGAVGSKGHHKGSKGHHNKGHSNKGFKNLYHKEEYGINKKFYDDSDFDQYYNTLDDFEDYIGSRKGSLSKGGLYKGDQNHNAFGQKGTNEQGQYYDSHGGRKGSYGNNKHYGNEAKHGRNVNNFGGYGNNGHINIHNGIGHGGHGNGYGTIAHGHGGLVGSQFGGYGPAGHNGHIVGVNNGIYGNQLGHLGGHGHSGFGHGSLNGLGGYGHGGFGHKGNINGHGFLGINNGGYGHGNLGNFKGLGHATGFSNFNINHHGY